MKRISLRQFYSKLTHKKKNQQPLNGQIDLTYRCNLNCIHCYCKGSEENASRYTLKSQAPNTEHRELNTEEWKEILDEIKKEGCLFLVISGGEPLIRDDFLEIYSYAKSKGFLTTLFTNGYGLTRKIINYLAKFPPFSIELTLNGITKETYEAITQVRDSFPKVIKNINLLAKSKIKFILKSNCLKQNKHEIAKIKAFADELLGKPHEMAATPNSRERGNKRWIFKYKYDPLIYARFNGDTTPYNYRLSPEELLEVRKSDPDIWMEYEKDLCSKFPELERDREFLYRCNIWLDHFFINPYGRLKFCQLSDKFSVDLRKQTFREGFCNVFPQLLKEKFKTDSKCKDCSLRAICSHCPPIAYLETGDEEAPIPYFCELTKAIAGQMNAKLPNC